MIRLLSLPTSDRNESVSSVPWQGLLLPRKTLFLIVLTLFLLVFCLPTLADSSDSNQNYCSPPLEQRIEARNLLEKLDINFSRSEDRFLKAIRNNDETLVRKFLEAGIIPEVGAAQLLRLGIETGSGRLVDLALKCVEDKDISFENGNGPIHRAAELGDTVILQKLLQAGFSPKEENDFGITPYLAAKRNNRKQTQQFLLEHGAEKPEVSSSSSEGTSLSVKVKHVGEAPEQDIYDSSGNSECGVDRIEGKSVVVNPNGTLQNVVVAVKSSSNILRRKPSTIQIDQKNCEFKPHVRTVQVGGVVQFSDSDQGLHNVRATDMRGRQLFNMQTFQGQEKDYRPENAQLLQIECDVHPWMEGYIYVTEHGYADVTGEKGYARLNDLPPGKYELTIWHEEYGRTSRSLKLDDASDTITVELSGNS